jgi:CDP-diacylglycerol--glycerol-3-phosphate 3-phosphatidyltransferase
MNLPNKLTASRFLFTFGFLVAVFSTFPGAQSAALLLFSIASITDFLDGYLARRDKLITNFGTLMDPLADKILTCSAFIAFVGLQKISAWMVVIIVARELAITGLRLLAASKQVVLAAERWGKDKTITQIIAILSILVSMSYPEWGGWARSFFDPWVPLFTTIFIWAAVTLTFLSGVLYLWRNRQLYLQDL